MAAVMLAGAPLCNEAYAVTNVTAETWANVDADAKIANGVKFVIKDATKFYKVATGAKDKSGKEYTTIGSFSKANAKDASVFEVRNFTKTAAGNTFELYVDGKPLSVDATGAAIKNTTETKDVNTLFTANSDKLASVTTISLAKVGAATSVIRSINSLNILAATIEANDLNANLSGQGFKLNFPSAASQPDVNPFADQMIAVKASDAATALSLRSVVRLANEVCFVVADEAGKKLLSGTPSKADYEKATFVIVDPVNNFGITGLNFDDAAGQGFTTVKGSALANANAPKSATDKTIEKYAFDNGVFSVGANDYLNAEEEYAISANVFTFKDGKSSVASNSVNIGAYSLMAGGLKTFITTVTYTMADKLAPATTGGNTYAVAADMLKADAPAVYNILFAGDKTSAGTDASAYGKYLTNDAVVAPKDAALDNLTTQWVVTSIDAKGNVTLKNAYDPTKEFTAKLYKTDEEGTFQANNVSNTVLGTGTAAALKGTDIITLTPATDNATFLTLSEEQLKQQVTLSFTDDQAVNVEDLYMIKDAKTGKVTPNKDASKAFAWNVEAVGTVNNIIEYAYLKDNMVVTAPDTVKVQTYYFYTEELNTAGKVEVKGLVNYAAKTAGTAGVAPKADEKISTWDQFAFVKDGDSYKMLVAKTANSTATVANTTYAYATDVVGAKLTYANVKTGKFASAVNPASFDHVNLNFESVSVAETSLEKAPRYATFESFYGAVSMAEENGIMQGIVSADAMTFWLDTVTVKDEPTFYISKGIAKKEETKAVEAGSVRNFLYMPLDSAYYWDVASAKYVSDKKYTVDGTEVAVSGSDLKAIFRPGALAENNTKFNTVAGGKDVEVTKDNGLGNFQFNIFKLDAEDENYVIYNPTQKAYIYNLNGVLAFTSDKDKALRSTIGEGDPTANEAIAAENNVAVIGGEGVVTVKGAAGKQVVVSNILGQEFANKVATSDEETIAVAAGVVVVRVDGEATKVVVK